MYRLSQLITRWGTRLVAAQYYCGHFLKIQDNISKLDQETSIVIRNAQNIIQNDLIFIFMNFSFITHTVITLESKNMSIILNYYFENCWISNRKIKTYKWANRRCHKKKFHIVTENNPGFIDFQTVNDIIISSILLKIWNYHFQISHISNMHRLHQWCGVFV